jgi:predicted ATPase
VSPTAPRLEIARESLTSLKATEAKDIIGFQHSAEFRKSVVKTTRRVGPLISTKDEGGVTSLMLHQDGGSRGRPIPAGQSPRTVVGGTNAAEYPTVLAARREMTSWQLLHLEPSVMRTPDQFGASGRITVEGAHLASTLLRLVANEERKGSVLQEATNRLMELVPEVQAVDLERDEVRQQIYVSVRMRGSDISMGPRALSDGTLRFLALVTLLLDPNACEVLCMEEPENGMHPARIPAALALLRDFAVDPELPVDDENPLRQVILNTHSPDVVRQLEADEVLFVDALDGPAGRVARVSAVENRWRHAVPTVPLQRMMDFIGGAPLGATAAELQIPLRFGSAQ